MKFQLEKFHRNVPDEDLLEDLRRVADKLGKNKVTNAEYKKYGQYSTGTLQSRFGGLQKALEKAGLERTKNLNVSDEELLDDLRRVADAIGKKRIPRKEYNEHGNYSEGTLRKRFGGWLKALDKAGLERTCNFGILDEEYFENLEEVWTKLGRQPQRNEMIKPLSKFSGGGYASRFSSWRNALERFVEFINKGEDEEPSARKQEKQDTARPLVQKSVRKRTPRAISWRKRFLVMRRDDFKCRFCGASPALKPGLVLHVDHIEPYSKGGETILSNLQTLCEQCNIGKSDLSLN